MKAILVIDYMPSSCVECPCIDVEFRMCKAYEGYEEPSIYHKPDWCPLRPLPEKIDDEDNDLLISYGWNACIEKIMGETE